MKDSDNSEGEEGDGGGLFTIVDSETAIAAVRSCDSRKRTMDNTDPGAEAVSATFGMKFLCRACGQTHDPTKAVVDRRGRTKVVPKKCLHAIPRFQSIRVRDTYELSDATGMNDLTPPIAQTFRGCQEDKEEYAILADIKGYLERTCARYLEVRQRAIEDCVGTPFSTDICITKRERDACVDTCSSALSRIGGVTIGRDAIVSYAHLISHYFPIAQLVIMDARTAVLDVDDGADHLLIHVSDKIGFDDEIRSNEPPYTNRWDPDYTDEYIGLRDKYRATQIFEEHYLITITNRVNRDGQIHLVPNDVTTIEQARKAIDDGREGVRRLR